MKKQKRFIGLILSLVMLVSCVSVSAAYPTTLLTVPTVNGTLDNVLGNRNNDNSSWAFTYDTKYKNDASFVVLDTNLNSSNEVEYLIATNHPFYATAKVEDAINIYTRKFDTDLTAGDKDWQYDPTDSTNIANWVNQYTTSGGGARAFYYIGETIWNHTVEKTWSIEASANQLRTERTVTANAVIPSYTEYVTYRDKLNAMKVMYEDTTTDGTTRMWLRTPANYDSSALSAGASNGILSIHSNYDSDTKDCYLVNNQDSANTRNIQLFFWVDSKFFREVKVDNIGSNAAELMKSDLSLEELEALYSPAELAQYFGIESNPENAPTILNMNVSTNIAAPGGTATLTFDSVPESEDNTIAWYICDDAQGTNPVVITDATTSTLTIPSSAAGKYIMAGVTPVSGYDVGYEVFSEPIAVAAKLETYNSSDATDVKTAWGMKEENDAAYMFSPASSYTNFIMLEVSEDGSDFLVIADPISSWASKVSTSGSGKFSMDPSKNDQLPAYLNGDYLKIENENRISSDDAPEYMYSSFLAGGLPPSVVPYINKNSIWRTEASVIGDEYVFKAAVTLPSVSEIKAHADKIGYGYGPRTSAWRTRTTSSTAVDSNGNAKMFAIGFANEQKLNDTFSSGSNLFIRPIFRLKREFFMKHKVNLTDEDVRDDSNVITMGSEVKKMLVANFARSELADIYSDEELALIGFEDNEPIVSGVNAQGIASVAQTLTADFDYSDPNGSEKTSVEYQWYYADSTTGDLNKITGATSATYEVTSDMLGKYIAVSVRATNSEGIKSAAVKSGLVGPIAARSDIIVTPVSITTAKAEFTIDNAAAATDMVILYCVYNKADNSLAHVVTEDVEAVTGKYTYSASVPSTFTVNTANHKVKAMVWDNLDTIRPYAMIELK